MAAYIPKISVPPAQASPIKQAPQPIPASTAPIKMFDNISFIIGVVGIGIMDNKIVCKNTDNKVF
jgi:hypothetical protein